jgi:hypothetical protein
MSSDRRKNSRFDTTLAIKIRLAPDGTPIEGSGTDVGPNGMRIKTLIPLVEASYVNITFDSASNHTHCEGRVVWTQRNKENTAYESGIDIQKWGGDTPESNLVDHIPNLAPKRDRRRDRR